MRYKYQNHFTDQAGNAVSSGRITVFNANTTVLATVYSSSGSTGAISNSEITTGTDGFFNFWVDTSDYSAATSKFKMIFSKTNFTTKTYDDIVLFLNSETDHYSDGRHKVITIDTTNTRIGINTTAPSNELHIWKNSSSSMTGYPKMVLTNAATNSSSASAFCMIDFNVGSPSTIIGQMGGYGNTYNSAIFRSFIKMAGYKSGLLFKTYSSTGIFKFINNTNQVKMILDQNGRVGLGTTVLSSDSGRLSINSPSTILHSTVNFSLNGTAKGVVGATTGNIMLLQANTIPIRLSADGNVTSHLEIATNGKVGICGNDASPPAISDGAGLHIAGKILRIGSSKTPASASSTGKAGEICWDGTYLYLCSAADTWRRIAHNTW